MESWHRDRQGPLRSACAWSVRSVSDMSGLSYKISLRVTEGFGKRLKIAAAEAEMPVGTFLESLLDARDSRVEQARRLQPSPLHRVAFDD